MSDQVALYEYALKNSGITDYNTIEGDTGRHWGRAKNVIFFIENYQKFRILFRNSLRINWHLKSRIDTWQKKGDKSGTSDCRINLKLI